MAKVPPDLKVLLKVMLNAAGHVRPDAQDFARAPYFDNTAVACLKYLSTLAEKSQENRAIFFKGLPEIIPSMNERILIKKFLPPLLGELKEAIMVPFVLPNILLIADGLSIQQFETLLFESLVPVFKLQEPIQILQIFLHKMEILLTKSPQARLASDVLPMIYRALEPTAAEQITVLALSQMPQFKGPSGPCPL